MTAWRGFGEKETCKAAAAHLRPRGGEQTLPPAQKTGAAGGWELGGVYDGVLKR